MESARSSAPAWVKKLVWNWKHARIQTDPFSSPLVSFLAPRIPREASLLDLGCAAGNLLAGLRRNGWNGEYVGVDVSPKAVSAARKMNDPRAKWIVSPIETFAIDRDFDVICFVESFYYVRLECAQEVLRRCRARGKTIYVRIWDVKTHAPFIQQLGACDNPKPDVFVLNCELDALQAGTMHHLADVNIGSGNPPGGAAPSGEGL
jgi:SAM-dependent methyltransferase